MFLKLTLWIMEPSQGIDSGLMMGKACRLSVAMGFLVRFLTIVPQLSGYLGQIPLVFNEVLEYLMGIGLTISQQMLEYLGQILLVFKEVLEYLMGIGLMIPQAMSEYLGLILLVFKEVLEYLTGIGLMVWLPLRKYQVVSEYHLGIGLMCRVRIFVEVMELKREKPTVQDKGEGELVSGPYLQACVAVMIEVLVEAPEQRVWRSTGGGSEFVDGGLGVPPVALAYRPPGYKDSKTYGDYGFERPPGLESRTEGPAVPEEAPQPAAPLDAGAAATGPAEPVGPSPIDVLITGMSQLQQVLLKQKNDVMDLEPKAVSELVKLPEYTAETGAIDFQDYLYLAEQQIGTLASGAGDWWARTLRAAQTAYAEYQTLSPVRRLGVVATLPEDLKEEKYKKLERKVAALVLASLPKGVRDDLVAYRVQGVHQILYRLMVIFQPGGAQDRAQLLKQLDVTESAAGPAEATAAIRRWYRLLQRASDLGVTLPDESLQVKSLSVIVKKTSEQNADFKFRLALARTELQIDTRPTQDNVMRYLQHLLAELEQLGAIARKSQTGTTPTTPTTAVPSSSATTPAATGGASLKGLQPAPEAKAKPKAGPGKKLCSWFSSDNGCRNGRNCTFQHQWTGLNRGERCLLCGSKQHRAKDCTAGGATSPGEKGQPPPRIAKVQPGASTASQAPHTGTPVTNAEPAQDTSSASSQPPPAAGGAHNKIDAARVTEILTETNKMLKSLTTQQGSGASPAPAPLDPLEMIQKQLDEVRRLKVMVVRSSGDDTSSFTSALSWYETRLSSSMVTGGGDVEEEEALLDSGASHAYRAPHSATELEAARRVGVSLATGEERAIPQNPGGTLLMENSGDGTILPMGQLVQLLGCKVSWEPNKLTVIHPVHGRLRVRLRGHCPVLPVTQALELIAELEQKRMASFERTVKEFQQQIKVIKEKGLQSWTWREHLQAAREGGDRTHVAGFLHKNPVFSTINAEALLGVPEHVPLGGRDGWNLLKGMPWSRSKRKALFQSDSWVVHLFSGEEKSDGAKQRDTMKRSFWGEALTGDEVLLEVDLTSSKSMDLLQRDGVLRVLAWAALSGKIKSIVGGPPRQTFPTTIGPSKAGGHHLREVQLVVRMMMLFYMAEEGRTALWRTGKLRSAIKPHVGFLLEHPGDPEDGRTALFQTPLWKMFALDNMMGEVPLWMNEKKVVLGGNLDLWHLRDLKVGSDARLGSVWPLELVAHMAFAIRAWVGLRNHEGLLSSLRRSSWLDEGDPKELNKFDVKDWKLHLQRDHLPYRKDCRTCIERASGRPHRRITHPSAYCLSIDTAGPFRNTGAGGYKYLLVGCYRHPKLPGTKPEEEPVEFPKPEEVEPRPDDGEDWLGDAGPDPAEEPLGEEPEGGVGFIDPGDQDDQEVEALKELAEPLEFVSVYVARPMRSRKKAETLKAIQELYIQLRSAGFPVARLHMDRAQEYQSSALEHWAAARDVELSRTQGDDPSQNGTAERAVGYVKMRVRVLLSQAKELSGVDDDTIRTWWPLAAETAVSQHQAMAMGRKFPSAARFGSRVFTRRKGYGAGRPDLKPKWIGGVYLGPARSVPGGHMVYTDEGNLWFSTNIRQFEDRAVDGEEERGGGPLVPDLLPARRVTGKTSAVELASGASLLPGASDGPSGGRPEGALKSVAALSPGSDSDADDESWTVVSDGAQLCDLEVRESSSPSTTTSHRGRGSLAAEYVEAGCYSMDECLRVLESEPFVKTRKQRTSAWKENGPPPIHTTLGAYQRGPFVGTTSATKRHHSLALYLTEFLKRHCGGQCEFTSLTVARDLNTEVHSDRFNLRNSTNYVLTLGDFQGGGVWVEGEAGNYAKVSVESTPGEILQGHVLPAKNRIVQIDPKKLHRTMPWSGGPKWTVIAHTIGARKKLSEGDEQGLKVLGFPLPGASLCAISPGELASGTEVPCGRQWRFMLSQQEVEEEMMNRLWTRRVLDEEEQLASVVPSDLVTEYAGVSQANAEAATNLHFRETRCVHERWNEEQWLGLCRMTESEEETFGVETMLEELKEPLKVVFTVALDEVKNYASRWSEAMHKEVKALLDAGALVPLTAEEQARLEASGKLVVLPAKGVFTAKPPDVERLADDDGHPLPQGSVHFVKRKARLVICGNFQGRQAREDSYAGGCQIDSLRAMLVFAAFKGWRLASTDIRNAFILAPIKEEEEEDDGTVYGLFPPRVFQLVAVPYCYQLWRVDRALYGFRRSPRLWSKFRDRRLRGARIPYDQGHLVLRQSRADTNVWAIVYEVDGAEPEIKGYLNIYVDDVLYVGIADVIETVQSWLTSEWKASELTWACETSVLRFLGLEIQLCDGGVRIGQRAYVDELIRHHKLTESRGYGTPCPQEWLLGECDESSVDYSTEQLRRAQTLTGELLWLSGRSRPDIMHSVCTMSSLCVKNPELVERIGYRVLGYLKATAGVCLWYKPCDAAYDVVGYSDASFAPSGSRSVGCSVACYYGCPVSWRCGRQSLVALSVAEAELLEAVNCVQLMSGLESFVEELQATSPRLCLRVDNQAAVGLTTEAAGTWKTRHLRVRAFALREAVRVEALKIHHVEGLRQLGDLGTKCFHKPRLEQLRELWGLKAVEVGVDQESSDKLSRKASVATLAMNGVASVLARLTLILGWLVRGSTAADDESSAGLELSFAWELYGLAILAVISAIALWELMKWLLSRCCGAGGELPESREARRLRKLQQVVHEEVGRYGLEVGVKVSSASSPAAAPAIAAPSFEERATTSRPRQVTRGCQTEPYDAGMRQHAGPFFASEHGDRVHHDPNCRGLRNAIHRTRRLSLCAYCYQRCPLYIPDDL
ncbi:unnamed protein product [Symbiodinium sp. CCMP2592]|nr:unnamed protein product [Symbiodinium sp. CCMP2592]